MARAFKVNKARKPVYAKGKTITYVSKMGKRKGEKLTRVDRTQPADANDKVIIEKGQPYWYWQFKNGPIIYSPVQPKRSQLTRSDFLSWLYDMEDEINEYTVTDIPGADPDDIQNQIDEWVSQLEEKRDECQEKLDNMPEGLQQGSASGELLQQRIDGLDTWISELEGVRPEWDDDELREEAESAWQQEHTQELQAEDPAVLEGKEQWINEKVLELKQEKIDDIVSDIQNCTQGIE